MLGIPSSLPAKRLGQPLSSLIGDSQLLAAVYLYFVFFPFPVLFSLSYTFHFEIGRDCRAIGLQIMPRLWMSVGALNDRNHTQMDWYAFCVVKYGV